jgi:hypothetical protein
MSGVVRRFFRVIRFCVILLALLLCLISATFWIRSYHHTDGLMLRPTPRERWISTHSGTLHVSHDISWPTLDDLMYKRSIPYESSFLGFGKSADHVRRWQMDSAGLTIYTVTIEDHFFPLWFPRLSFRFHPSPNYAI